MSNSLLVNSQEFYSEAAHIARKNLLSRMGKKVVASDPFALDFLTRRFLDLLIESNLFVDKKGTLDLPSKTIILDYLVSKEISPDRNNPHKGAQACEFWGGIFYEHIIKDKILNLDDFAQKLSWSYALLASETKIYSYWIGSEFAERVLSAFRMTSKQLEIATRFEDKLPENVVRLVH